MLMVYTNTSIIPIAGCNSTLNPMDDLTLPDIGERSIGCIAPYTLKSTGSEHYFLSRRGIEEYDGRSVTSISFNPSRRIYIESLLQRWENKEDTFAVLTADGEYWIVSDEEAAINFDNEVYNEEYYTTPSTQVIYIYDINKMTWRSYNLHSVLNHIYAVPTGKLAGTVLTSPDASNLAEAIILSPTDSSYIMQMDGSVYYDRDEENLQINIVGMIEPQELRPLNTETPYSPRRFIMQRPPTWHHVYVDAYSTGSPFYTIRLRDRNDNLAYLDLNISSDVRTQRTGGRLNAMECQVRIRQFSQSPDEIRRIIVEWTEF
jgi:hypothetical protein